MEDVISPPILQKDKNHHRPLVLERERMGQTERNLHSRLRSNNTSYTPTLTLMLLALEVRLEDFCVLVNDPSTFNVSCAAELFDNFRPMSSLYNSDFVASPGSLRDVHRSSGNKDQQLYHDMSRMSVPRTSNVSAPTSPIFSPVWSHYSKTSRESIWKGIKDRKSSRQQQSTFVVQKGGKLSLSPSLSEGGSSGGGHSPASSLLAVLRSRVLSRSMSSPKDSPARSHPQNLSSPWFLSPMIQKYTSSYFGDQSAEQTEWEEYITPFQMFAGCEAVFSRMDHVMSVNQTSKHLLIDKYDEIASSLQKTRRILCNPLLSDTLDVLTKFSEAGNNSKCRGSTKEYREPLTLSPKQTTSHAAHSVSLTILSIEKLCKARKQQIQIHDKIFNTNWKDVSEESPCLLDIVCNIEMALKELNKSFPYEKVTNVEDHSVAKPLLFKTITELEALKFGLCTYHHLYHCRFYETILAVRKFQVALKSWPNKNTPFVLYVWLSDVFDDIKAKMQLFFDRITAFQTMRAEQSETRSSKKNETLSNNVKEFLWRHHQKGGPHLVFAIVLKANSGMPCFEKGFILSGSEHEENVDGLKSWPAIFQRSTRCLAKDFVSSTEGAVAKTADEEAKSMDQVRDQKVLGYRSIKTDKSHHCLKPMDAFVSDNRKGKRLSNVTSFSLILDAVTDGGKGSDLINLHSVKEYHNRGSWPSCIWHNVVSLIQASCDDEIGNFFRFREDLELPTSTTSSYYFVKVSNCLWSAILLNQQNRPKYDDKEIISFIKTLSRKLYVDVLFNVASLVSARDRADMLRNNTEETNFHDDSSWQCFC